MPVAPRWRSVIIDAHTLHQGSIVPYNRVIAALWGAARARRPASGTVGQVSPSPEATRQSNQVALYYEIFRHNIFEVQPSPEGKPNSSSSLRACS